MNDLSVDEQYKIISKGAAEIIPENELRSKIESSVKNGVPLVVKLGCDPGRAALGS